MTVEDEHLAQLIKATMTTGCQYIALGLAHSVRAASGAPGSSVTQFTEIAAAEATWQRASKALDDYRASRRAA